MANTSALGRLGYTVAEFRRAARRYQMSMGIPLHRADVPVDSCSAIFRWPHGPGMEPCNIPSGGKHRADSSRVAAEQDER